MKDKSDKYIEILLLILTLVLVVLCFAFLKEYMDLRKLEIPSPKETFINIIEHHGPFTAADAGMIQGWMTFDYINRIFDLPANYLKTSLHISDIHYPRDVIFRYAAHSGKSSGTFLKDVQNAVSTYLTGQK